MKLSQPTLILSSRSPLVLRAGGVYNSIAKAMNGHFNSPAANQDSMAKPAFVEDRALPDADE